MSAMEPISHVPESLLTYLDSNKALYQILPHPRDFSAQETAADTHTPGRSFAKCVLMWIDNYYAMVVIPADARVDVAKLRRAVAADHAGLIAEKEMARLFPDCELGAEPPFGNLYDLPVYVAVELTQHEEITFNAGSHEEAVRMPYPEFARLVEPIVVDCVADE